MDINTCLDELLSEFDQDGDFAVQGEVYDPPPVMSLEGVGYLPYPWTTVFGPLVLSHAQAAPYGRGDETIVDPTVRKSWQIGAEQLTLEDAWTDTLDEIVAHACAGLGVEGLVEANLYKLLIYEEGGFFAPHRDTEKQERMFATLVVELPSDYDGGELIIEHNGRTIDVQWSGVSFDRLHWTAFYTDCVHELKPVTRGMRAVLVYNLYRVGDDHTSSVHEGHQSSQSQLTNLLKQWGKQAATSPERLVIPLGHEYSPAGLTISDLKGRDRHMVAALQLACDDADVDLLLGIVSLSENGAAEHRGGYWDDDELVESDDYADFEYYMTHLHALDELPCEIDRLPIELEMICPFGALDGALSDTTKFYEATGNEGASYERSYRHAALVLWPSINRDVLIDSASIELSLESLAFTAKREPERVAELFERAMRRWSEYMDGLSGWSKRGAQPVVPMLELLVEYGDAARCKAFLSTQHLGRIQNTFVTPVAHAFQLLSADGIEQICTQRMRQTEPDHLYQRLIWMESVWHWALDEVEDIERVRAKVTGIFESMMPTLPSKEPRYVRWDHSRTVYTAWGTLDLTMSYTARLLDILTRIEMAQSQALSVAQKMITHPEVYLMREAVCPAIVQLGKQRTHSVLTPLMHMCLDWLSEQTQNIPEPPTDWRRPFTGCGCVDCEAVGKFMADPHMKQMYYPLAKARRRHVHEILDGQDCSHETIRQGRPYKLDLRKTSASFEQALKRYGDDLKMKRALKTSLS